MGLTERLARSCATHAWRTLAAWGIVVLVSLVLIATSLHGLTSNSNVSGKPESAKAADLLAQAFPPTLAERRKQTSDVIVVSSSSASPPALRQRVASLVAAVRATKDVGSVRVSAQRDHAALIGLFVGSDSAIEPVVALVQREDGKGGFAVAVTGDHTVGHDFGKQSQTDLEHGELAFGLPAALLVLLLVFGSVVGGLVPVLMAILSILVGLGVVAVLSQVVELSVFIVNMLTGMGLALGIDYSLFVVSRYREERVRGDEPHAAIARAGATASRAVLFSGSTFVIALLGMLLVPTSIMRSLAAGAIIVGVVSVCAALTLLPALLGLLGDRVNALRVPFVGRNLGRADAAESRFWRRIIGGVLAHPAIYLTVSVAALLLVASPTRGLHVGASSVATLPERLPSKQGFLAVQRWFPTAFPYPATVVVQNGGRTAEQVLTSLKRSLAADPRFGAGTIRVSPAHDVVALDVPVRGDANSRAAVAAVRGLRSEVQRRIPGTNVYVGGHTAEQADYYDAATRPTPYVLTFVLGLSFVLLTVAFRSIVVALVSIALNLLSVGAAYGLLTWIFVDGHGAGIFGFQHVPVVDAWVPLFLFSVLFGLSMDYQVFLMSRIKERFDRGATTREAVASGVASTARIITGAALIIVVVFVGFARGELVMFQQMGFGVAVALLIDATIIRSVVLPSALALLDERSWYLPSWLAWLPHVEVERAPESGAVPT